MGRPRVLYVGMLCEAGSKEDEACASIPEGVDDHCWFGDKAEGVTVECVRLARGEALPRCADIADAYDAVIVGGTFHSAHSPAPWLHALHAWLGALRVLPRGPHVLGICGGHQAIALVLQGAADAPQGDQRRRSSVATMEAGPALGTLPVTLTAAGAEHALFRGIERPAFHFGNYDEVAASPEGASTLATLQHGGGTSPAVAVDWGGGWISTQFHPEAPACWFQHLVDSGIVSAPPAAHPYSAQLDCGPALIANFLRAVRASQPAH